MTGLRARAVTLVSSALTHRAQNDQPDGGQTLDCIMKTNSDFNALDATWNQCTYNKSPEYSALVGYEMRSKMTVCTKTCIRSCASLRCPSPLPQFPGFFWIHT